MAATTHTDRWVLSRNFLDNGSHKYPGNDASLPKLFDYRSQESENKLRFERPSGRCLSNSTSVPACNTPIISTARNAIASKRACRRSTTTKATCTFSPIRPSRRLPKRGGCGLSAERTLFARGRRFLQDLSPLSHLLSRRHEPCRVLAPTGRCAIHRSTRSSRHKKPFGGSATRTIWTMHTSTPCVCRRRTNSICAWTKSFTSANGRSTSTSTCKTSTARPIPQTPIASSSAKSRDCAARCSRPWT